MGGLTFGIGMGIGAGAGGGSGIWGIADNTGAMTYYATYAEARAVAVSGDTIQMLTNVEETSATEVILKDGVNINLNGYTYTLNVATTENAVTDNAVAVTCTISNGTIKRTGGTHSTANSLG